MNEQLTQVPDAARPAPWWQRIAALWTVMLIGIVSAFAQTTLIDAAGAGGFNLGSGSFLDNGWTAANSSSPTVNPWVTGTAITNGAIQGSSAYVSNNGGTSATYDDANSQNYFYRDVAIPAGQAAITLEFDWMCQGESAGAVPFDMIQVFYAPTSVTPAGSNTYPGANNVVPAGLTGATVIPPSTTFFNGQSNAQHAVSNLPTSLSGTTVRIIFGWKNDGPSGVAPAPAGVIDNVSLISYPPIPATCATTYVPANAATGVATNASLTWSGATGVPTPVYDVYFSTNQSLVQNADPSVRVLNGTAGTTYTPPSLNANITYYWMVVPLSIGAGGPYTCVVNSFTTTTPTSTAIGGLANDANTWGGIVPPSGSDIVIPSGTTVTWNITTGGYTIRNLDVNGTLQIIGSPSMTITGNVNIGATGRFIMAGNSVTVPTPPAANAAITAPFSFNIGGSFTNDGYADLMYAPLSFNGTGTQFLQGTGVFAGTPTKGILGHLSMWGSGTLEVNTTQNLILRGSASGILTNPLAALSGTINTNGKLEVNTSAQPFGSALTGRCEAALVTGAGTGLLNTTLGVTGLWAGAGANKLFPPSGGASVVVNDRLVVPGGNVYLVTQIVAGGSPSTVISQPTHTSGIVQVDNVNLLYLGAEGTIGNGFQTNSAYTVGTQVWYGANLYTVTVAGTASSAAPPVHTSGTAVSGTATFAYAGTAARVQTVVNNTNNTLRGVEIVTPGTGYFGGNFNLGWAIPASGATSPAGYFLVLNAIATTPSNVIQKNALATINGALPINNDGDIEYVALANLGYYGPTAPAVGVGGPTGINLLTAPQTGYTTAPTASFTDGTKLVAAPDNLTVTLAGNTVTGVKLGISPLFTVPPTSITLTGGGGPTVTVPLPPNCWAQVSATTSATTGQITSLNVLNPGKGYIAAPTINVAAAGAGQVAASTPVVQPGLYSVNLTFQNAVNSVPVPVVNGQHTEANMGPLMPGDRRFFQFQLGSGGQGASGITLTGGDLRVYAASSALTFGNGILNTGSYQVISECPDYGGTSTPTSPSYLIGTMTLSSYGGNGGSTIVRQWPFSSAFQLTVGVATSTATQYTASQATLPNGSGASGDRAYRLQLPVGQTIGSGALNAVQLQRTWYDNFTSDDASLLIVRSTALTGPWTVTSNASGTVGTVTVPTTRSTNGFATPVPFTGDDYFAWSTNYTPLPALDYTVARTTNVPFNSIATSGTPIPQWANAGSVQNYQSTAINWPNSTFQYQGMTVTGFQVSVNGFMRLLTAAFPTAQTTGYSSTGFIQSQGGLGNINLAIAPFHENIQAFPNTTAGNSNRIRYQINGLNPGQRQLIIEWNDLVGESAMGSSFTFQAVLDENDNSITFNYGQMSGVTVSRDCRYSYGVGLSGGFLELPPRPGQIFQQQYENSTAFGHGFTSVTEQGANGLSSIPESFSRLKLTPGTYPGFTPPSPVAPANDESAGAITLTPVAGVPGNLAGRIYSSRYATPSAQAVCAGNADDDVWFKFVATQATHKLQVIGSGGFQVRSEVLDASLAPLPTPQCLLAPAATTNNGYVVNADLNGLTVGATYYLRIYHNNGGTQATATATVSNGQVTGISITNAGSGYVAANTNNGGSSNPPVRLVGGGGYGAVAQINSLVNGQVASIQLLATGSSQGIGYTSAPTVVIDEPDWGITGDFSVVVYSPLANDECAGAITIPSQFGCVPVSGSTYGATASAGVPACTAATPGTADDDVWYQFTATSANPTITLQAVGPNFDPVLQLYSGTCAGLTSLSCVNTANNQFNFGGNGQEIYQAAGLTLGNTYYIRVYNAGAGAAEGTFTLCVDQGGLGCPSFEKSFTGNLTGGNTTVTLTAGNTTELLPGMLVVGGTIPAGTTIASITSATQFVLSAAPTNNGTGQTIIVRQALQNGTNVAAGTGTTLRWFAGSGATSYDVYMDTNNPPTTLVANVPAPAVSYATGVLSCNQVYYWTVVPKVGALASTACTTVNNFNTAFPNACPNTYTPANNTVNVAAGATLNLTWANTGATDYEVFFGTTNPPTTSLGITTGTTMTSPVLSCATTYFWRVQPRKIDPTCGTLVNTTCAVNQFSTNTAPPPCAIIGAPALGAVNVQTAPVTLSWTAAAGSTGTLSYNVYFGTTNPPTTLLSNVIGTSQLTPTLTCNTTYYWRVAPVNCVGEQNSCTVWSFTTVNSTPACANLSSPADNSTPAQTVTGVSLSWSAVASANALYYNVYLGTTNPPTTLLGVTTSTSITTGILTCGQQYYWRVETVNCFGTNLGTCGARSFFAGNITAPSLALQTPSNGATQVSTNPTLSWNLSSTSILGFNVYFGDNSGVYNPVVYIPYVSGTISYSYTPPAPLLCAGEDYFWRVDPVGPCGVFTGTEFSFTTVNATPSCANPASYLPTNGSTNVWLQPTLQWASSTPVIAADQWQVYLGTSFPLPLVATTTTNAYTPSTPLIAGATYYWDVIPVNCNGAASCPASPSSFTTTNNGVVAYDVAGATTTYASIAGTGTNPTWGAFTANEDISDAVSLPLGFSFQYAGAPRTAFRVSDQGYITFAASPGAPSSNNYSLNTLVVAPLWDNLNVVGNQFSQSAINSAIFYQIDGNLPNRVVTVEWKDMERFQAGTSANGSRLNFQVKLYESSNVIEFVYGYMQGFDGSTNASLTYSLGMSAGTVNAPALPGQILTQQFTNEKNFSHLNATGTNNGANGLREVPRCYSKWTFTPGTYSGNGPAIGAPTNDEAANAVALTVNAVDCIDLCDNYYRNRNATASATPVCGGNADDDVWFTFVAPDPNAVSPASQGVRVRVRSAFGHDAQVQVLDATLTNTIACVNGQAAGLIETLLIPSGSLVTGSTYYVRVYNAGAGSGTTGEFNVCASLWNAPIAGDECTTAITITETVTCNATSANSTNATPSGLASVCSFPVPVADDDLWFQFVAQTTNPRITVNSIGTFNAVVELYSGGCSFLVPLNCTNAANAALPENIYTSNLVVGQTYFVRVFHLGPGAASGQFDICVQNGPDCPVLTAPTNGATVYSTTPTLSWNASTPMAATGYDVLLGTTNPPTTVVSANQPGTSYTSATLAPGTYYWRVDPRNANGVNTGCTVRSFTIPSCFPVNNVAVTPTSASSVDVSWTCIGCTGTYIVEYGPAGLIPGTGATAGAGGTIVTTAATTASISGLGTSNYVFYVRQECTPGADYSQNSPVFNYTAPASCALLPQFTDLGGVGFDYGNNTNQVQTICAQSPGQAIMVTFTSFSTQVTADALYVYDGPTTASPLIASANGSGTVPGGQNGGWWGTVAPTNTATPGVLISTNPSGCFTFQFISGATTTDAGWTADVTCLLGNTTCANAAPIGCFDNVQGTTMVGTNTLPPSACAFNGAPSTGGVSWWVFTATGNDDVLFQVCNPSFDARISVFKPQPDCSNLVCVGGVDNTQGCGSGAEIKVRTLIGEVYYVAVHGTNTGSFVLTTVCDPTLCAPLANDACSGATNMNLAGYTPVTLTDNNTCALIDGPTLASGTGPVQGLWYTFNSGVNNVIRMYLGAPGTAAGLRYALFDGTCNGLSALSEVANGIGGGYTNLAVTPGTQYKLLVYNSGGIGVEGTYTLSLEAPPLDDAAITAILSPLPTVCGTQLQPVVKLANLGENTLTGVVIN
ncbi:MAG: hypothetical protein JNL05_03335, partial [Flavobacteriales bacterium]|nr:hypothetical protein [Flavobacteriales bacterium]